MRLYRCRLDIRACHPAPDMMSMTEFLDRGFHAPRRGFHASLDQVTRALLAVQGARW
jgi:hypothetical protein